MAKPDTITADSYEASLRMGKKSLYLGRFPTSDLAHQAYITAKCSLHAGCTI